MKPLNDYRHIRGVCYQINPDEEQMRRELGYGKRVGLNSIRFWTSAVLYERDGDAYIQRVKRQVQVAWECGYTSMPILFNGNGMTNDDEPKTLSLEYRKIQEEFCEKMIEALKDEPGLLMWDVMNEPYISYFLQQSPPEKRAERRARVDEFIKHFINFIRERDPDNAITVGYALTSSFEPTVGLCDVISIHNYDRKYEDIKREHQITSEVAAKYGKPFEINTGAIGRGLRTTPYPSPELLSMIRRAGASIMINSDCHNKDFLDCGFDDAVALAKDCGFKEHQILTKDGWRAVPL